jgi:phospholipid/cholesterol/gamma-HCH transport system permease protein
VVLNALGAAGVRLFRLLGGVGLVFGRTLLHLPTLNRRELLRALNLFGTQALPLTLGASTLIGLTVVIQAGVYANRFGARLYTGWAASYALVWEFGPLLLGLIMSARVGARNAAELALLQVNGQLEGLAGISLNPFGLLVAPRVVASAIAVTLLSMVMFSAAILMEAVAARFTIGLPPGVFFESLADMLKLTEVMGGIAKAAVFGVAIALVSTTCGLAASGGARGVGRAAAQAVVASCAAIFALDFALTPALSRWAS